MSVRPTDYSSTLSTLIFCELTRCYLPIGRRNSQNYSDDVFVIGYSSKDDSDPSDVILGTAFAVSDALVVTFGEYERKW